jgi:hypothetical protein
VGSGTGPPRFPATPTYAILAAMPGLDPIWTPALVLRGLRLAYAAPSRGSMSHRRPTAAGIKVSNFEQRKVSNYLRLS